MVRPLAHCLNSFLDRFEERLQVDCERMKRKLVAQVDQRFGVLREKVTELRSNFDGERRGGGGNSVGIHLDDPPVETVPMVEWIRERRVAEVSSGQKRKSSVSQQSQSNNNNNKRQKKSFSSPTVPGRAKRFACKYPGCTQAFTSVATLIFHERIHLGVKPYTCSWPACNFASERFSHVTRHVRHKHFKLPVTLKEQKRLNIIDEHNPEEYVRVDNELVARRLE